MLALVVVCGVEGVGVGHGAGDHVGVRQRAVRAARWGSAVPWCRGRRGSRDCWGVELASGPPEGVTLGYTPAVRVTGGEKVSH